MHSVLICVQNDHDHSLLCLAVFVCVVGVYATFALSSHARRSEEGERRFWRRVSILAGGCTAWATHFVALLAFRPRMPAAFAPLMTAASLIVVVLGIGIGVSITTRTRRYSTRFLAGVIIGASIAALHYLGQAAYVVQGSVHWDLALVIPSVVLSVAMSGLALVTVAASYHKARVSAAPIMLLSIAILHFCGMAAMTMSYDPLAALPADAISPRAITPVVAGVCLSLLGLAFVGWRFDLAAKAQFRRDGKRLRELTDVALEGLLICDGDVVVTTNNSLERLAGIDRSRLQGISLSSLLVGLDLSSLPDREEHEAELISASGQRVPVRVLRNQVQLGDKRQAVFAVRDQRERLHTEAVMRSLTLSDPLTRLPNRTHFFDVLSAHCSTLTHDGPSLAVLMIDLDRFKPVNDTLGHAAGDALLRKVADRLSGLMAAGDMLARLGGDEFAVVHLSGAANDAARLAARIVSHVGRDPYVIEGQAVNIGASVGIAAAPADGDNPAELLRTADLALYAAKADGKGTFRFYDRTLDEAVRSRRSVEAGLRRALAHGEMEVHYQPLMDSRSGLITGAEALVRWRDPVKGLVPPSDFIPLAEETGLIVPLGTLVLRTACEDAASWPRELTIAVNVSPVQFKDASFVDTVRAALEATGLAPHRLELEITEGVLLTDEKHTLRTLTELREIGIMLSMDDFGTGYSSLNYLRRFPFNKIKIDRSFVQQTPTNAESVAIIRAIITMGACLGMKTTVEGVETAEQLRFSVAENCDQIQGFAVSRPLPSRQFTDFLNRRDRTDMPVPVQERARSGEVAPV